MCIYIKLHCRICVFRSPTTISTTPTYDYQLGWDTHMYMNIRTSKWRLIFKCAQACRGSYSNVMLPQIAVGRSHSFPGHWGSVKSWIRVNTTLYDAIIFKWMRQLVILKEDDVSLIIILHWEIETYMYLEKVTSVWNTMSIAEIKLIYCN